MKKQNVEFKVGNETLRGSLFIPEGKGPFPAVVFFHGRGSDRTNYLPMAEKLAQDGILALAFDFRGCGESDGDFKDQTHSMGVEDGKAGLEFILRQNVDRERIGIQGTSFGGYIAGMVLSNCDFIKSVVLRVPATYSDEDSNIQGYVEDDYHQRKANRENSSSYNGLSRFKGSLLVVRAENDELIPEAAVNKYFDVAENAKQRKLFVQKNAGHSLSANPKAMEDFHKIAVDCFLETL